MTEKYTTIKQSQYDALQDIIRRQIEKIKEVETSKKELLEKNKDLEVLKVTLLEKNKDLEVLKATLLDENQSLSSTLKRLECCAISNPQDLIDEANIQL